VGEKSFKKKKKGNRVGGGEEIKFQTKKKQRSGKKNWEGGGQEIKLQKRKRRSGLRKGKQNKVNLGWHRDRKENPISAHPSTLVHWWVLVHSGPFLTSTTKMHVSIHATAELSWVGSLVAIKLERGLRETYHVQMLTYKLFCCCFGSTFKASIPTSCQCFKNMWPPYIIL
jgi:hypothetical protein